MDNPERKSGCGCYLLALVLLLAGAGIAGFLIYQAYGTLSSLTANFIRVVVPGKHDITLSQPGSYTVFYEYQSVVDGKVYSTGEDLPNANYQLRSKVTGAPVALSAPSGQTTYSLGNISGKSAFEFTIDQPGEYELEVDRGAEAANNYVLAVGQGAGKGIVQALGEIFGGLAVCIGSGLAAFIIVLVTFLRRPKTQRAGPPDRRPEEDEVP